MAGATVFGDDLLKPPETAERLSPKNEFKPSWKEVGPDTFEMVGVSPDQQSAIDEFEKITGHSVPEGLVPRQVEAKYDPAAWHRDEKRGPDGEIVNQPAYTKGITRYKWVFDLNIAPAREVQSLIDWVLNRKQSKVKRSTPVAGALVVSLADLQVGKVQSGGGTKEMLDVLGSKMDSIKAYAHSLAVSEVVIADLGDGCENTENVAGQAYTNDLSFTDQLDLFGAITMRACTELAEIAPVRFVAVPSNHMQLRKGYERVGAAKDDFGILNARSLARAFALTPLDVQVVVPEDHEETLGLVIQGLPVGFVHGHQVGRPDRIPEWWAKQTFGDQPIGPARLLLTAHFHHLRVQHVGTDRTWIQSPTMDGGSDWFRYGSGETSKRGILTVVIRDGQWDHLRVF